MDLVHRIFSLFEIQDYCKSTHSEIRFYGGWYEHGNITKLAQDLSAQISGCFPTSIRNPYNGYHILVSATMAYSLFITPREHLYDTYRRRCYPNNLRFNNPKQLGCADKNCSLHTIYEFLISGSCRGQTCHLTPQDIIYKGEQKLVDTMISCDMYYLNQTQEQQIVLVSSDDDFWPCIRTSLVMGKKVLHIHTHPSRPTPVGYSQYATTNYRQIHL